MSKIQFFVFASIRFDAKLNFISKKKFVNDLFSNYQHQSFFCKIRFRRIFVFFGRDVAVREIRDDCAIRENRDDIRFSIDFVFNVDMFDNAKNENENEIDFSSSRFYRFRNFRSTIFEFVKNDDVFRFDVQMKKKKIRE